MARPPGHPKSGGRQVGTPNRSKILRVEEYLTSKGIHPVQRILDLLPTLDPADQVKTWLHLIKYIEPELKPAEALLNVTPSFEEQAVLQASDEELLALEASNENGSPT